MRQDRSFKRVGVGVIVTAALALGACGGTDSSAQKAEGDAESVDLMLEWAPNASQVWAIAGDKEGKFEQNGIKPNFLFPDDSTSPVKVLLAGKADFVLQLSTSAVTVRGQGEPVKVIGTLEALDVGVMVAEDKVDSIADLKGKTVGVGSSTYNETCFERLLTENGLKKGDVKVVDPGFNLVSPMLAGKFDGVNASHYEQAIALAKGGLRTKVFSYQDNGCPIDPIQMVTTEKMIEENPELVRSVLKSVAESIEYSMDNPEDAAAHWAKAYPDLDAKSDLAQWQASVPTFCTEHSETKGLLYSDPAEYEGLIQVAKDADVIDEIYPVEDIVDNSFLPDPPITAPCANDRWQDDPLSQIKGLG